MQLEAKKHEVVGFLPFYTDSIVSCKVLGEKPDGSIYEWTEYYPVERVRKELARCYALDLSVQAEQLRRKYHRAPPLPMYLHDGRILVPFKFRLIRTKPEASYGYIDYHLVRNIAPGKPHQCTLTLINGETLPIHSQINTARLALFFAGEIKRDYFPEKEYAPELVNFFSSFKSLLQGL